MNMAHPSAPQLRNRWWLSALVALITLLAGTTPARALDGPQNRLPEVCQGVWGAAYSVNEAATWITPPPLDLGPSLGSFGSNIGLKQCPPQIVAPPARYLMPDSTNATSDDPEMPNPRTDDPACYATVKQKVTKQGYDNFLGGTLPTPSWSDDGQGLGTPALYHFNTSADVRILGRQRSDDPATSDVDESLRDEMPLLAGPDGDTILKFGVGRDSVTYRADTLLSWLDLVFIYIPEIPAGSKAQKEVVKASSKLSKDILKGATKTVLTEAGNQALDQVFDLSYRWHQWGANPDVYNEDRQQVWVFDRIPPVIRASTDIAALPELTRAVLSYDASRGVYYLEAIQPGGIKALDAIKFLQPLISAHDHCNREVMIANDSGGQSFWRIGQTIRLTWTATDPGPVDANGGRNKATVTQTIEVRDTHAPSLLAPPSRVVEVPGGQTSAQVPLGSPRVYDLAQLEPTVANNASGNTFALGLNEVTWTASDGSNTSQAVQLITVKEQGTNKPPVADSRTIATQSYQDTEITLSGSDPDYYPNVDRHDPLTFDIVTGPQHGYFVAPLLPFFIDDYRLEAGALKFTSQDWQKDPGAYCRSRAGRFGPGEPSQWQMAYPYRASWMSVDDAGNTMVSDNGSMICTPGGDLTVLPRLAVFNAEHDLVANADLPQGVAIRDIHWDLHTHNFYVVQHDSQSDDAILVFDGTLTRIATYGVEGGSDVNKMTQNAFYVTTDASGILYVAASNYVNAYRQIPPATPYDLVPPNSSYLGRAFSNPTGAAEIKSIAADSAGNLLVGESDRIFKVSAATATSANTFSPGTIAGWLGKCSENLTNTYACDVEHGISIGYSCTNALCGRSTGVYGDKPGQFNGESAIAIDPNDVLYVADSTNRRIQRFTADGLFAGQAKSTGVGYGFLLGDFGNPYDVEVNSTHFYVLNTDANLLHSFATTPITPIDDSHAKVVYRSNNNYVGADGFRFSATDGLAQAEADVAIDVSRNFRAPSIPRAAAPIVEPATPEDTPITFTLSGTDPDGALDTLSVQIVTAPQHGTVTTNGLVATYTPDANYNGPVSFTYRVYDGRDLSPETAEVSLTVDPVEDPPSIDVDESRSATLGFKIAHRVNVSDPDADETLLASIDWGDGTSTSEGHLELNGIPVGWRDATNDDGTAKDGLKTTGPILQTDPTGHGSLVADHAYAAAGEYQVTSCVQDRTQLEEETQVKTPTGTSKRICGTTQVTVSAAAQVTVDFTSPEDPVRAGATVTVPVTLTNHVFDIDASDPRAALLPATGTNVAGLKFTIEAPQALTLVDVRSQDAACTLAAASIDCAIATLDYGQKVSIDIDARVAEDAPGKAHESLAGRAEWTDMPEAATGAGVIEVASDGLAPSLAELSSATGVPDGYESITLTGEHFKAGARVRFGALFASEVRVMDARTITARTPAQPDGLKVDVMVVNPDDQSSTLNRAFTYELPKPTPPPEPTPGPGGGSSGSGSSGGGGGGAFDLRMLLVLLALFAARAVSMRQRS